MAQYNKGRKYTISFKLVNSPSRFPLKPARVLVTRNFICSLQRYCESLMLKKNELTLKKGEKNLYLSINMMRAHVWKAKNNVLRGSIVIPFYQSAAPFVSFPLRGIHSSLLLLFQNKRQSASGPDLLEIRIFGHFPTCTLWSHGMKKYVRRKSRFIRCGFQSLRHMDAVRT